MIYITDATLVIIGPYIIKKQLSHSRRRMSSTRVEYRRYDDEEQSLLRHGRRLEFPSLNLQHWYSYPLEGERWTIQNIREKTTRLLSSKIGHYSVISLVCLDILGMVAGELYSTWIMSRQLVQVDFILRLFKCEQGKSSPDWNLALNILGSIGLVFSCLFMIELIVSVWAFGWKYGSPTRLPYFDRLRC